MLSSVWISYQNANVKCKHHHLLLRNPFLTFETSVNADVTCEQGFGAEHDQLCTLLVDTAVGVDVLWLVFGVSQAAHFVTSGLFCIIHVLHSQLPAGFLNKLPTLDDWLLLEVSVKQDVFENRFLVKQIYWCPRHKESLDFLPLFNTSITLPDLSSVAGASPTRTESLGSLDKMSITLPGT